MFTLAGILLLFGVMLIIASLGPVVIDPKSSPLDRIWKR